MLTKLKQDQKDCAKCFKPILEEYLTILMDKFWHEKCVYCTDCGMQLTESCYSRQGKIFCRRCFYNNFAPRCSGCDVIFRPTDLVRKARNHYFHVNCFTCFICHRQLMTGDQLYVINDSVFVCTDDYNPAMMNSNSAGLDCGGKNQNRGACHELTFRMKCQVMQQEFHNEDPSSHSGLKSEKLGQYREAECTPAERVQNLETTTNTGPLIQSDCCEENEEKNTSAASTVSQTSTITTTETIIQGDQYGLTKVQQEDKMLPEEQSLNGKRGRGPRTTIKSKQLERLKTAFEQTPKPTRLLREQLALETGLPMRVIQVWFQNKRSKERRMKQIFIRGKKSTGGVSLNVYNNNMSSNTSTLDLILDSQDNFYYENDAVVEAVDTNLEIQHESSQLKTNSTTTTTTLTGFQNFTDFMINTEEHQVEEIFESSPTLGQDQNESNSLSEMESTLAHHSSSSTNMMPTNP